MQNDNAERDLWGTNILEALLEHEWGTMHQYLDEVESVDEDNWTILHWACREKYVPLDVINLLLTAYPPAAIHRDVNGCAPLHIALDSRKPLRYIDSLVKSCHETLCMVDDNGKNPLHIACNATRNTTLQVIEFLVKEYPEAALQKDYSGKTPLHEAIACVKVEDEVIDLLLKYCPDCASIINEESLLNTPLHLAVHHKRSARVMRALLDCKPDLLLVSNAMKMTAEDLFYREWDRPLIKFLESFPSSVSPRDIWNANADFSISYLQSIACFFLDINAASNSSSSEEISTTTILYSSIRCQTCPWSFCELFLRLYPDQFLKQSSKGALPIELVPNISKRKFYEWQMSERARIIHQLRTKFNNSDGDRKILLRNLRKICQRMFAPSNAEEVKMVNFLFKSIRENPEICASRKKRKLNEAQEM